MKSEEEVKGWLLALEAERLDTSWRKPKEPNQPTVVYRDRPVDYQARDSIMFNAGRWAAGARDKEAMRANRLVAKLIKGNKK